MNDHLKLVNKEVAAQRDILATVLLANMAVISGRAERCRPPDLGRGGDHRGADPIASFYGMNFEHMPELDWVVARRTGWI